jgi:hypothetical protein
MIDVCNSLWTGNIFLLYRLSLSVCLLLFCSLPVLIQPSPPPLSSSAELVARPFHALFISLFVSVRLTSIALLSLSSRALFSSLSSIPISRKSSSSPCSPSMHSENLPTQTLVRRTFWRGVKSITRIIGFKRLLSRSNTGDDAMPGIEQSGDAGDAVKGNELLGKRPMD